MSIDPANGSSAFGIVATQFVDGIVQILHAEEYQRLDYNEMPSTVYGLIAVISGNRARNRTIKTAKINKTQILLI